MSTLTGKVIDLDDISDCPRTEACETCGTARDVLTLTVGTRVGVTCIRVCERCVDPGGPHPFESLGEAMLRVTLHCGHLGITPAQMAAVLDAETWHERGGR